MARVLSALIFSVCVGAVLRAQNPAPAAPARGGRQAAPPAAEQGGGRGAQSPASQRPPQTAKPQEYPAEQVRAGGTVFSSQCGFCHGRDAAGGDGGCANCHAPGGDLAGVAKKREGLVLLQRMLYPTGGRGGPAPAPATVTVTLGSGQTISGKLAYRDEFVIALTDADEWYRSWPATQVTFTVNNQLR